MEELPSQSSARCQTPARPVNQTSPVEPLTGSTSNFPPMNHLRWPRSTTAYDGYGGTDTAHLEQRARVASQSERK